MAIHKLYSLIDPLQVQYFQGARVLILQSINVKKKHIYEISCQSLPCLDQWQWILAPQNDSG